MYNQIQNGLIKLIQPGKPLWIYPRDNFNHKKIHIRSIVDDRVVVYRFWRRNKKFWQYDCDNLFYFQLLYENGNLYEKKP